MPDTGADDTPKRRRIRASHFVLILVGVALVLGATYLATVGSPSSPAVAWARGDVNVVFVASRDLPAFHQISQTDIIETVVEAGSIPVDAIRDRELLLNRYTLIAMPQSRPFSRGQLGPILPLGLLDGSIFSLPANGATTIAGKLSRGDTVDIVMPGNGSRGILVGALVVDLTDGADASIVLSAAPSEVEKLATTSDLSSVRIVRTRAYSGP